MSATVKFRRHGRQYLTEAIVLPCLRDHPEALPTRATLKWDSGADVTLIYHQVTQGVEYQQSGSVVVASGDDMPTMTARVHIVFIRDGPARLITASMDISDAPRTGLDGLIGADLGRTIDARNGVATVALAQTDSEAQMSEAGQQRGAWDERLKAQECGCWGAFERFLGRNGSPPPKLNSEQSIAAVGRLLERHFEQRNERLDAIERAGRS